MQKEENKHIIPTYQCDLCDHSPYKKPGLLALHNSTEYNVYPESHYYINTHWCPICMHDFESIVRVREHIDQTHHPEKIGHVSCFDIIKQVYTKLTEEELEQVKIDVQENKESQKQKQVRERKTHSISRRSEGPIPPEIHQFQQYPANEDSDSEIDEEKEYSPDDPVFQRKLTKLIERQYQSETSSCPSTPQDEHSLNIALDRTRPHNYTP